MRRLIVLVERDDYYGREILLDETLPDFEHLDLGEASADNDYPTWGRAAQRALPGVAVYAAYPSLALVKWEPQLPWEQWVYGEDFDDEPPAPWAHDIAQAHRVWVAYDDGAYKALHRVHALDLNEGQMTRVGRKMVERWCRDRMPGYCEARDYLAFDCGFDYIVACCVTWRLLTPPRVLADLSYLIDSNDD